jgi:hypothetical protein
LPFKGKGSDIAFQKAGRKPEQREREICISPGDLTFQKARVVGKITGDEGKLRVEADTSYGGSDHITLIGHVSAGMGYRNESGDANHGQGK